MFEELLFCSYFCMGPFNIQFASTWFWLWQGVDQICYWFTIEVLILCFSLRKRKKIYGPTGEQLCNKCKNCMCLCQCYIFHQCMLNTSSLFCWGYDINFKLQPCCKILRLNIHEHISSWMNAIWWLKSKLMATLVKLVSFFRW